jgi:hypothetical protein
MEPFPQEGLFAFRHDPMGCQLAGAAGRRSPMVGVYRLLNILRITVPLTEKIVWLSYFMETHRVWVFD